MTTATWSSGNSNTNDAEFRAWGSELSAKLAAVGLTQTSDTGQINWLTVTRPAVNTDGGYEVWSFNDTLQATAPVYIKFYYGCANNVTYPRIKFEVGTGSNGSGTLTGTGSGTLYNFNNSYNQAGSATAQSSYLCYNATQGFLGWWWKSSATGLGAIQRTVDSGGATTATGLVLWSYGASATSTTNINNQASIRFATTARVIRSINNSSGYNFNMSFQPGQLSDTTLENGDKQAYACWGAMPEMVPLLGNCVVQQSEYTGGTTFSATMVGSTAHTYLAMTANLSGFSNGSGANMNVAMLWE